MAWAIGANDVANSMGTSVGSGAITVGGAILIAGVFEFLGAFLAGGEVTSTIRKGIIDAEALEHDPDLLVIGMLSALLAVASRFGWPVSTTHSIVGAIIGFAVVAIGFDAVHWWDVTTIAASWVVMGFALGFAVRVRHDGLDELEDFLNVLLAPVGNEIACDRLRGDQRGPGDGNFGRDAGPCAAVEGFNREVDEELIGRDAALAGSVFDALPLLGREPDVLLQCDRTQAFAFRSVASGPAIKISSVLYEIAMPKVGCYKIHPTLWWRPNAANDGRLLEQPRAGGLESGVPYCGYVFTRERFRHRFDIRHGSHYIQQRIPFRQQTRVYDRIQSDIQVHCRADFSKH